MRQLGQLAATQEQRTRPRSWALELARLRLHPRRPATGIAAEASDLGAQEIFRRARLGRKEEKKRGVHVADLHGRRIACPRSPTPPPASSRNDQLAYPLPPPVQGMTLASASPYLRRRRRQLPFRSAASLDEIPANVRLHPTRKRLSGTARWRRPSTGARRTFSRRRLRIVSRRISRSSAVSRTSCTWECLSVPRHSMDSVPYRSFYCDNALGPSFACATIC